MSKTTLSVNVAYIKSNIKSVFKNRDIKKLKKATYTHITLHMSFIAHFNLFGFQNTYKNLEEFAIRLLTTEYSHNLNHSLKLAESYEHREDLKNQYGEEVIQSWGDATKEIRRIAIAYLKERSESIELQEALECLRDTDIQPLNEHLSIKHILENQRKSVTTETL